MNLDTFNEKLASSLKRIAEDGIDMQRMIMVIDRAEREVRGDLFRLKLRMYGGLTKTE